MLYSPKHILQKQQDQKPFLIVLWWSAISPTFVFIFTSVTYFQSKTIVSTLTELTLMITEICKYPHILHWSNADKWTKTYYFFLVLSLKDISNSYFCAKLTSDATNCTSVKSMSLLCTCVYCVCFFALFSIHLSSLYISLWIMQISTDDR